MKFDHWQPVLTGDAAAAAWQAIEAIAEALPGSLGRNTPDALGLTGQQEVAWRASLAAGSAGQALFYTYLAKHYEAAGDEQTAARHAETALGLLDQAFEGVASAPMSESLYAGFPGVAWVAAHLSGRLFSDEEDGNAEVDGALLPSLLHSPWRGEYDLMHGLAGLGVYALERLPAPSGVQCLEAIVDRLAERAQTEAEGLTWFSPPETVPEYQRETYPQGLYNLGASHGAPGVMAFLGGVLGAGVAVPKARRLLAGVTSWVLARRASGEHGWYFPHFFYPGIEDRGSRIAWCYGDPGVASSLLVAARGAGDPELEKVALEVGLAAAARRNEAGVRDAGLCHGAGGVGHLFQRLYQLTGEVAFADAARFWLERALALREPGLGFGGFRAWSSDLEGRQDWRDDAGFLEGAAGIGLALLAAVSPVDPEWDRAFLLSPPAR